MAAQCLEKRMKAAAYDAAQDRSFDFDPADPRRPPHPLCGRTADEADLYSLHRAPISHGPQAMKPARACNQRNRRLHA